MVRLHAETFGFDTIGNQFLKYEENVKGAHEVLDKYAEIIRDTAIGNATAGGLRVTGAGIGGIQTEDTDNGKNVGWATRPNFHLYFHERGFHAIDNRQKKQRIWRDSKGARKRHYKPGQATYVPPTPHMRPAFRQHQREFIYEMVTTVQKNN